MGRRAFSVYLRPVRHLQLPAGEAGIAGHRLRYGDHRGDRRHVPAEFSDKSIIIYFGVLQCLGVCMLLWPVFRKLPVPVLLVLGVALSAVGLYLRFHVRVEFPWLIPLGFVTRSFASSDYFPLLPNFGYFLVGAFLGRTFYPRRVTCFPKVNPENPVVRFLGFFGKHSLLIYMAHQPVLAAAVGIWVLLFS